MNGLILGETAELLIARDENLFSLKVRMTNFRKPSFILEKQLNSNNDKEYNYWLR